MIDIKIVLKVIFPKLLSIELIFETKDHVNNLTIGMRNPKVNGIKHNIITIITAKSWYE